MLSGAAFVVVSVLRAHRTVHIFSHGSRDNSFVMFRSSTAGLLAAAAVVGGISVTCATGLPWIRAEAFAASSASSTVKAGPIKPAVARAKPAKRAKPVTAKRTSSGRITASVAGVSITAPIVTAPAPASSTTSTATSAPVTTTSAPTTTTSAPAPIVAPFDVVAVNERADAVVGTTASFSIVVAQRGASNQVVLSLVGLPNGMGATLTPNPATSLALLRIAVPTDAIAADYPLRVLGSVNGAQAWANIILRVTTAPASSTTSTTSTTIDPSGLAPSFGFRVIADGKTLVNGGQVQYEIEPIYDTGYNGSIEYFVSGLPDGVWHGFSEKVTTKKTTLWLSATVPLRSGRYPFTITGVSKGFKKSGELLLIIG